MSARAAPELLPHELRMDEVLRAADAAEACSQGTEMDKWAARTQALSVRTRTHPQDVSAWLQHVQHQDTLSQASGARNSSLGNTEL